MEGKQITLMAVVALVTFSLIGGVYAQQSQQGKAAPTLQNLADRIDALEKENKQLRQRVTVLEAEKTRTAYVISEPFTQNRPVTAQPWVLPNTGTYYQAVKPDPAPLRWDPNGRYEMLIQGSSSPK